MQIYYNLAVPIPQAEWYAIMQLNYFTNSIKINDRFIFGTLDNEVRENNAVFKVKSVIKSESTNTFSSLQANSNSFDKTEELLRTPLVVLALDKDAIAPKDNFNTRIANNAPVYLVPTTSTDVEVEVEEDETSIVPKSTSVSEAQESSESQQKSESQQEVESQQESKAQKESEAKKKQKDSYILKDVGSTSERILLGRSQNYKLMLLHNNEEVIDAKYTYTITFANKPESEWGKYFIFTELEDGSGFSITNIKSYISGKLKVIASYNIPNSEKIISKTYSLILDKAY